MWTFLSFLQIRTRKINSDSCMSVRVCVSARSVSAAARCLCRRSRVSCGWRRMGRSRGRSVTSSSGLQESTMSPKAKPRSVRLQQTSHGTLTKWRCRRETWVRVMRTRFIKSIGISCLNTEMPHASFLLTREGLLCTCALFLTPSSSKVSFVWAKKTVESYDAL